jgi:hypothetical protein
VPMQSQADMRLGTCRRALAGSRADADPDFPEFYL